MKKPRIRTYTIKIKGENWDHTDDFESDCWYNAQVKFTGRLREIVEGKYIRFDSEEESCMFGLDYKGPGLYPIKEGDTLLDSEIYDTFFDGQNHYTIRTHSKSTQK